MRRMVLTRYGGAEALQLQEGPLPAPEAGQIRIRVQASGVNFADVMARVGLYPDAPPPPFVIGYEVAGVVDALGPGVQHFREGDRVVALTRFGGYAEAVCVPEEQALRLPEGKDFVEAAALPVNFLTAYLMVEWLAALREGDRILIHGAAGGVGQAALQLAKARGAETFGTASPSKHGRLREMGLDHPIDYRNLDFEDEVRRLTGGRGVDVILDPISGRTTRKNFRLLAPMGRLYLFGVSSFNRGSKKRSLLDTLRSLIQIPFFHPIQLMNSNKGVHGVNIGRLWEEKKKIRRMFEELGARWEAGEIQPVIDTTFPLSEVDAAHDRLQSRMNFGKVVLTV